MDGRTGLVIVLVLILVGGLGWYFYDRSATTETGNPAGTYEEGSPDANTDDTENGDEDGTTNAVTVTYSNTGFSPASVTVTRGTKVTFVNQSSQSMWIAVDPHPAHTGYDNTSRSAHCSAGYTGPASFDACAALPSGAAYSFTFTKAGEFDYHNHVNASHGGTVMVNGTSASAEINVNVQ